MISLQGMAEKGFLLLCYLRLEGYLRFSSGGLEVELWTDNSLPFASVDQILLGARYLYGTIWTYGPTITYNLTVPHRGINL